MGKSRHIGEMYPLPTPPFSGAAQSLSRGMLILGPGSPVAGSIGVEQEIDFANIVYSVGDTFATVVNGQLMIQEAGVYFASGILAYDTPGAHAMTVGIGFSFAIGLSPANMSQAQASGHIAVGMLGLTVPDRFYSRFTPGANGNLVASGAFIQRFSGP